MGNNANITVPARTHVYLAVKGTAAPADAVVALAAAWKEVGYTTTDSLEFDTEPQFQDVSSAQSDFPTRKFQTSDSGKIQVDLQEWSGANFSAVYGGGTLTSPSAGVFKFAPPQLGERGEVTAIVEVIDGTKHYRYIFPRVFQEEGVTTPLHKGSEATLPLRLSLLGDDNVDAWYLLSDDPAFDPAA